jgi:hypothetical protein
MKIRANWRDLLRELVAGKEWAPIARRGKLNSTFLRDVLERGVTPQIPNAEKLSNALGIPITDWFLEPPPGSASPGGDRPDLRDMPRFDLMPRDMPVLGAAQCGDDGEFEFNSGPIDYVKRPPRLYGIREAYALYVVGNSMWPWAKSGTPVYVHPGQPYQIEDFVVVQMRPQKAGEAPRAFIKQLIAVNSKTITLQQFEPKRTLAFQRKDIQAIHRVVPWGELYGV